MPTDLQGNLLFYGVRLDYLSSKKLGWVLKNRTYIVHYLKFLDKSLKTPIREMGLVILVALATQFTIEVSQRFW